MQQQNKKKVLIFLPGGVGGAERMSVLIGKLLPRERFYVKYVVVGRLQNIYNILPKEYDVDCIPVRNKYELSTLRIWWKIMREKPNVVFSSQVAYNPRVIIAAKLARRKVVIRSSGMPCDYAGTKFRGVKWTYPMADKIIAQQDDMKEEMIKVLGVKPYKTVTIYNPLDTSNIDKLSNEPSPYQTDGNVNFVQSASVNYRKAQDVSIKAFAIVIKKLPTSHLYFVGGYDKKSEYYKSLTDIVNDLHIEDRVHFVGYDKNPFRWVKYADCFVFPSRAEGLPNALIEASYLQVPCAASRCLRVVDEIIKDGLNGYVVEVDDIEGMANAMKKAVNLSNCKMIYKPGTQEEIQHLFDL